MRYLKKKIGALFLVAAVCLVTMLLLSCNVEAKRKKVVKKRDPIIKKTLYVGSKKAATIKVPNARNSKKTIWRVITSSNCIKKITLKKNAIQFYASKKRTGKFEVCAFRVIKRTKKEIHYRMIPIRVTVKKKAKKAVVNKKTTSNKTRSTTAAKPKTTTAAKPKTTTAAKPKTTTAAKPKTTTAAKPKTTTAAKPKTTTAAKRSTTKTVSTTANKGISGTMHGKYGVFLGLESDEISKLNGYDTVVIEPQEFTASQVAGLKAKGKTVLAYLNVGAIENYRSYYAGFKHITLGAYDGWPNERWINVADVNWQNYVVNTLAKKYISMGFQGFYVDNLDVYYHFETAAIYNGSLSILRRLMAFKRIIMVNGADLLVRKLIAAGTVKNYLNVVNQEEVFSTNDGDVQDSDDTEDYKEYLALVKSKGLKCCLLEYGTDSEVLSRIQTYARQNGFFYYYAPDSDLD